ncbi:unnamed protein product [Macrosiphum euphorbiae]|uniref:Uncharacterized protein n=1 Tax=Macrosiphum euphorbiae TaxID=13131 RepID=A0AAV0VM27_9HEMI|nr:unnamed protein product [Macrosiphum euphorbiae]
MDTDDCEKKSTYTDDDITSTISTVDLKRKFSNICDIENDQCRILSVISDDVSEPLTWELKRALIGENIHYPECSYPPNSRRSAPSKNQQVKRLSLSDYLLSLDEFSTHSVICLDGVNGSGKSTIANNTNRTYIKTNMICPDLTRGSDYNFYIFHAFEYLLLQINY